MKTPTKIGSALLLVAGLFALPAGVLASGFSGAMRQQSRPQAKCPHCGKKL